MPRLLLLLSGLFLSLAALSQNTKFGIFLNDTAMTNASVSFVVADAVSGVPVFSYNPRVNLIPASTMKLVTSSAALEMLGPEYSFRTELGYTGRLSKRSGRLSGDIVIKGGGDPCLGSENFCQHYNDFTGRWVSEIKNAGIRKITGRIIVDDSYYDYEPAAPRWLWEDMGVSYGAGVYGLSVFDNTCRIKVNVSSDSSRVSITGIEPPLPDFTFTNRLSASGNSESWYVYSVPYSNSGWLSGSIPNDTSDYFLDAAIPDPPLLMAKLLDARLEAEGIDVSYEPSTNRLSPSLKFDSLTYITETVSPLLSFITDVLNKESVNLYAEHFVKELGKQYRGKGTTKAGLCVINEFLAAAGIDTSAIFLEDGSGLSARNGLNAEALTNLLIHMKNRGKYFREFFSTLPDAGQNGTLSDYFTDSIFESNLKAKSGSMTRVRCYAGYFRTISGREMAFCIMVNNFRGSSSHIIRNIEEIIKECIMLY